MLMRFNYPFEVGAESGQKSQRFQVRLKLREAESGDARLLWAWANDPAVRTSSLSPDTIPWDDHLRWYQARLASDATVIFIAERCEDGTPLGQVRFELEDKDTAGIDISVDAAWRNCSFGSCILEGALAKLRASGFCKKVIARVKEHNPASRRLFERADFSQLPSQAVGGETLLCYERVLCEGADY
jgi:UDP-2,4-diacetamido-2,4,6-trideoxy-beta-L-altropyranose hydrolase